MTPLQTHQSASAISRGINGQAPHVARYLARVDAFLDECPCDAARRGFLGDQIKCRQNEYDRFIELVNANRDVGPVTAFDHLEVIAALDLRLEKYRRVG